MLSKFFVGGYYSSTYYPFILFCITEIDWEFFNDCGVPLFDVSNRLGYEDKISSWTNSQSASASEYSSNLRSTSLFSLLSTGDLGGWNMV